MEKSIRSTSFHKGHTAANSNSFSKNNGIVYSNSTLMNKNFKEDQKVVENLDNLSDISATPSSEVINYLKGIEEINDLIFTDSEGISVFLYSAQETLDLGYISNIEEEFR